MVEGARLEIVWAGYRLEGSNPFASAKFRGDLVRFRCCLCSLGAFFVYSYKKVV